MSDKLIGFKLSRNSDGHLALSRKDGSVAAESKAVAEAGLSVFFGKQAENQRTTQSEVPSMPNDAICPPVETIVADIWVSEEWSDKLRATQVQDHHICEKLETLIANKEPRLRCTEYHVYSNFILVMECPVTAFPKAVDNARAILSEAIPNLVMQFSTEIDMKNIEEFREDAMSIIEQYLPDNRLDEIRDEILELAGGLTAEQEKVLDNLFIVCSTHNMPGYMPDADPYFALETETDPAKAFQARKNALKHDVQLYYQDDDEIDETQLDDMLAEIDAYDTDDKTIDLTYHGCDGHVFQSSRTSFTDFMQWNDAAIQSASSLALK